MNPLDNLNLRLLVCNGVKQETAEMIMVYFGTLKKERDDTACIVDILNGKVDRLTEQRDQLERWKNEMLEVGMWWNEIDKYVRLTAHENGMKLGDSVAKHALRMIKEGHELREEIKTIAKTLL